MEIKPEHEIVLQNNMLPYLPIKDLVTLKLVGKKINKLITDFVNAMKDKLPIVDFGPVTDPLHVTYLICKSCEENRIRNGEGEEIGKELEDIFSIKRCNFKLDDINQSWIFLVKKMNDKVLQRTMCSEDKNIDRKSFPRMLELFALAPEIDQFKKLKTLFISCQKLTRIPGNIGNLQNLERLDISDQNLNTLPNEIGNLANLLLLKISDSNLKKLPKSICNLKKLQRMSLRDNKLKDLPEGFGSLPALTVLHIQDNTFKILPEEVYKLKAITCLAFGSSWRKSETEYDFGRLNSHPSLKVWTVDQREWTTRPYSYWLGIDGKDRRKLEEEFNQKGEPEGSCRSEGC